ncbi:hypothetical protein [Parasalinivibrio latis]
MMLLKKFAQQIVMPDGLMILGAVLGLWGCAARLLAREKRKKAPERLF